LSSSKSRYNPDTGESLSSNRPYCTHKEADVETAVIVREARTDELAVAAQHYLGMRREVGWDDAELADDWEAKFVATYERATRDGEFRYFVAETGASSSDRRWRSCGGRCR
jgi:hypothetical protein